ncbi:MAG: hypothetical protein N5P05_002505 [Chroococcopsis gigantea SAG 12.99]|jgi:hypothetical protein|nr:hypothetical protein [Chroococcopsis gigantea SAG 12.99]
MLCNGLTSEKDRNYPSLFYIYLFMLLRELLIFSSMFSIDNLGERTLNKIAEFALSSQIDNADKLTVEIKTDPSQLAKGMLNSLAINGQGLVMNKFLRMQEMRINLTEIAVKPFPALLGNIQLTQPSQGTIDIVFNDSDIENVFKASLADLENIKCKIIDEENIEISLDLKSKSPIVLRLKPEINEKDIEVKVLKTRADAEISPELMTQILQPLEMLLNLEQFQIDGVSVTIRTIIINRASVQVGGIANITHFPKV